MAYVEIPASIHVRSAGVRAIFAELSEDVIRRMRNWVRWDGGAGVSVGGASGFILDYGTAYQRTRELAMPIQVSEAEQTQAALCAIEDRYGTAVALFWKFGEEASFREMGVRLACDDKTCKARIIRGHTLVTAEFYRRQPQAPDRGPMRAADNWVTREPRLIKS